MCRAGGREVERVLRVCEETVTPAGCRCGKRGMGGERFLSYFAGMIRIVSCLFLILITGFGGFAQPDAAPRAGSDSISSSLSTSRLRVSLVTCGPGEEVWETFGHTAIRVVDSMTGADMVFNYGTFEFGDDFLPQFVRGKLLYYLSYYPYVQFVPEYLEAGRSMQEQVLLMDAGKKEQIYTFLKENAREENRYYKYDFFFDNCATRLRDVFPNSLGAGFKFGNVLPEGKRLTYRNIINQYFYRVHWQRFGVNILLGSRIDKVMTNEEVMFLPDFLRDGVTGATVNGQKISTEPYEVLAGKPLEPAGINAPFLMNMGILILTVLGSSIPSLKRLGQVMSGLLLFLTGFIGVFILVMWFGTDHQACQNNYSLLWALPTNAFIAFAKKKNKDKYAVIAMILIGVSLVLHLFKVQELPLLELSPLLMALLFVYGMIYRKNRLNSY
jgi:hypothetical protein